MHKNIISYKIDKGNNSVPKSSKKKFFTVPYVSSISESFLPIAKKFSFEIAHSVPNTLKRFIIRGKDKIDFMSQNEVVYKIGCLDCDAIQVGQTMRQLGTRIKLHVADINKKNDFLSVISNHRLERNHEMKWNEIKILDTESSYSKRLELKIRD